MKILIASSIAEAAITELSETHEVVCRFGGSEDELIEAIDGCDALVFRSGVQVTRAVLEAAPGLSLIVRAGSGFDNIDLAALGERRIRFIRIPGPGARAVAEMSFALMLSLARRVTWADSEWRRGHWVKPQAQGRLLEGKVLGILGAGNIGATTGRLGAAWGMEAIGCVEHPSPDVSARLARSGVRLVDFDEVIQGADFLSIHVPLQPSTVGLIGRDEFKRMKPGSFLINMARGGVVDEAALAEALDSGHIAGAALDVHAAEGDGKISPLAEHDRVILTPHIGAQTIDSQMQIGELIVEVVRLHGEWGEPQRLATVDSFHIHPGEGIPA